MGPVYQGGAAAPGGGGGDPIDTEALKADVLATIRGGVSPDHDTLAEIMGVVDGKQDRASTGFMRLNTLRDFNAVNPDGILLFTEASIDQSNGLIALASVVNEDATVHPNAYIKNVSGGELIAEMNISNLEPGDAWDGDSFAQYAMFDYVAEQLGGFELFPQTPVLAKGDIACPMYRFTFPAGSSIRFYASPVNFAQVMIRVFKV